MYSTILSQNQISRVKTRNNVSFATKAFDNRQTSPIYRIHRKYDTIC